MDWEAQVPIPAGTIEDVQSHTDHRRQAIDAVGIKGLRHPLSIATERGSQQTVATISLAVPLPAERRGTHMSRFIDLLMEQHEPLTASRLPIFLATVARRLDAAGAEAEFRFPLFLRKRAPISGVSSYLDYEIRLGGSIKDGLASTYTEIQVPVTSLCPCSKEISRYGAHNQRSHIRVKIEPGDALGLEALIGLVEDKASAPLYGLLKRTDEKFITEQAYDNPRFVEDTVREIALVLRQDQHIRRYSVEAENFESIHNHSAWAVIAG